MDPTSATTPDEQDFTIRLLSEVDEFHEATTVLTQVWGASQPKVNAELLRAVAHAGGYVAGAFAGHEMIGASFGFLARHRGEAALHSHMTGIVGGVRHTGIGRSMKRRQRAWAAEHDLNWVVWTFDPLVRANAWFNLEVLGASVDSYAVNFYGAIDDGVNAGDESDRMVVAWPTHHDSTPLATPAITPDVTLVATPPDIVELRRTDPDAARDWRLRVRSELGGALARGCRVLGFTRGGEYRVMQGANE